MLVTIHDSLEGYQIFLYVAAIDCHPTAEECDIYGTSEGHAVTKYGQALCSHELEGIEALGPVDQGLGISTVDIYTC